MEFWDYLEKALAIASKIWGLFSAITEWIKRQKQGPK